MAFAHRTRLWRASTRLCTRDLPRLCTCNLPRLCTYDLVVNHIRVQDSCAMGHSHALVLKGRSTFSLQAMQAILEPRGGSGNEFIGLMSYMPILYMHCVNTCAKFTSPPHLPLFSQCDPPPFPSFPNAIPTPRPSPSLFPMRPIPSPWQRDPSPTCSQCNPNAPPPSTFSLCDPLPHPPPLVPNAPLPLSPMPHPLPWFPMRPIPQTPPTPPCSPCSLCDPFPISAQVSEILWLSAQVRVSAQVSEILSAQVRALPLGVIELVSQFHHQHADKQITMPFDMQAVVFDDIHQCCHQWASCTNAIDQPAPKPVHTTMGIT